VREIGAPGFVNGLLVSPAHLSRKERGEDGAPGFGVILGIFVVRFYGGFVVGCGEFVGGGCPANLTCLGLGVGGCFSSRGWEIMK